MIVPRPVSDGDIARIVRYAPLVPDLNIILRDPQGYALLGLRVNEPAKGKYFLSVSTKILPDLHHSYS